MRRRNVQAPLERSAEGKAVDDAVVALTGLAGDLAESAGLLDHIEGPERDAALVVLREEARRLREKLEELYVALGGAKAC